MEGEDNRLSGCPFSPLSISLRTRLRRLWRSSMLKLGKSERGRREGEKEGKA
jgi:hypothetical protein